MESIALHHAISVTHHSSLWRRQTNPLRTKRFHLQRPTPTGRFQIHSKRSDFQDSQGYAKPSRLLPATEVKIFTANSEENVFSTLRDDKSQSLYKVKLGTSSFYGSSLSDLNAGILLCMIDETGDSILQRIPSSLITDHSAEPEDGMLQFQRGSVDEFIFEGPKLGKVEALWISLESGQWRLGSVSLTIVCGHQSPVEENGEKLQIIGCNYNFQAEDILLGEGSNASMVELRPCLVTMLSGVDPFTIFNKSMPESTLLINCGISNEETMREYADLKLSLLLYDAILIAVGTSVASFSAGENVGGAFLTGGTGGFLYLLLLQRSVDELPTSELTSRNTGRAHEVFGGSRGPIFGLALAMGATLFAVKYGSGDVPIVFTPKEVVAGMIGFLACKVAVVLAAVKPITTNVKINE